MNILLLGKPGDDFIAYLKSFKDDVTVIEEPLGDKGELLNKIDFIISYRYRYILNKDILNRFNRRAINLHISYLPWNKGADPNLWSILEDTPKGVTIHYMDVLLDSGPILAQKEVELDLNDTLKTSYNKLTIAIEQLFFDNWPSIRGGTKKYYPMPDGGSSHRIKDKKSVEHLLARGWDTPIKNLIGILKKGK